MNEASEAAAQAQASAEQAARAASDAQAAAAQATTTGFEAGRIGAAYQHYQSAVAELQTLGFSVEQASLPASGLPALSIGAPTHVQMSGNQLVISSTGSGPPTSAPQAVPPTLITLLVRGELEDFTETKEKMLGASLTTLVMDAMHTNVVIKREPLSAQRANRYKIQAGGCEISLTVKGKQSVEYSSSESDNSDSSDGYELWLEDKAKEFLSMFWPNQINVSIVHARAGSTLVVVSLLAPAALVLMHLARHCQFGGAKEKFDVAGVLACKLHGVRNVAVIDNNASPRSLAKMHEVEKDPVRACPSRTTLRAALHRLHACAL